MKTFSTDTGLIESYLLDTLPQEERLVVEARLLTDDAFAQNLKVQKQAMHLVHCYGRRQMRTELNDLHRTLFSAPAHSRFRQMVLKLFR